VTCFIEDPAQRTVADEIAAMPTALEATAVLETLT